MQERLWIQRQRSSAHPAPVADRLRCNLRSHRPQQMRLPPLRQKSTEEFPRSTPGASEEEFRNTRSPPKPWEMAHQLAESREIQLARVLPPAAESPSAAVPCPRLAIVAARQSPPPPGPIREKCGQGAAQQ